MIHWKKIGRIAAVSFLSLAAVAVLWGIFRRDRSGWTEWERKIIIRSDSLLYVTVLPEDSLILRTPSKDVTPQMLQSALLKRLTAKMLHTVRHPSQDGVGIAAPQVGINRRIIWVQRFDKEGEPFECYINPRLDSLWGPLERGGEGCLSVPPLRGEPARYQGVTLSYLDPQTGESCREEISGYTAVIFQHECDHLDGILYIDRVDSTFVSPAWQQEREEFSYKKPLWWGQ